MTMATVLPHLLRYASNARGRQRKLHFYLEILEVVQTQTAGRSGKNEVLNFHFPQSGKRSTAAKVVLLFEWNAVPVLTSPPRRLFSLNINKLQIYGANMDAYDYR